MNIEQLDYIVRIAQCGSISEAADQLHVSQAGISKAVANLEEELRFKLFMRSRMGTVPTDKGTAIIAKAREILVKIQEIKEEAQTDSSFVQGEIRIAVSPNFMAILPKTIVSFKHDYPNVQLEVTEQDSEDIVRSLREDKADIGLICLENYLIQPEKDLIMNTLVQSRMVVCVSKLSPLASRSSLTPYDIQDQPFVSIHGSFSARFNREFAKQYGRMNILFSSTNPEVLKKIISEGTAIGLFIDFSIKNDPLLVNGDIVAIPLVEHEPAMTSLGWARQKQGHFSNAQKQFVTYLTRESNMLMAR